MKKTKQKKLTPTQALQEQLQHAKIQRDNAEEIIDRLVTFLCEDDTIKEKLLEHLGDEVREQVKEELIDQLG